MNPAAFIFKACVGCALVAALCLLALLVQGASLAVLGGALLLFVAVVVCVPDDALPRFVQALYVGPVDKGGE